MDCIVRGVANSQPCLSGISKSPRLSCVKQIASGKLLYNTVSPAWRSLMTQRGGTGGAGRLKNKGIHTYLWLIDVVIRQQPTQHCKAIIPQFNMEEREVAQLRPAL